LAYKNHVVDRGSDPPHWKQQFWEDILVHARWVIYLKIFARGSKWRCCFMLPLLQQLFKITYWIYFFVAANEDNMGLAVFKMLL